MNDIDSEEFRKGIELLTDVTKMRLEHLDKELEKSQGSQLADT